MEFYTQNKLQRPVRLCEETRKFAFDSLNRVYGQDTLRTMDVSLDEKEGFANLSALEKYDTAILQIAKKAPIRICENERISGAATLGWSIRHAVPATYEGKNVTVVAKGDLAPNKEVTFKLTILGVVFEDTSFENLLIGKDYEFKLNAFANNGSTSKIYYELKEGSSLPKGFSLLADGTIIGKGQDWGKQSFTILAKSEGNETVEATITLDFYTVFEQPVEGDPSDPIQFEEESAPASIWESNLLIWLLPIVGIGVALVFVFVVKKRLI